MQGSNLRPPACKARARCCSLLPSAAEPRQIGVPRLNARSLSCHLLRFVASTTLPRQGSIQVAIDVGLEPPGRGGYRLSSEAATRAPTRLATARRGKRAPLGRAFRVKEGCSGRRADARPATKARPRDAEFAPPPSKPGRRGLPVQPGALPGRSRARNAAARKTVPVSVTRTRTFGPTTEEKP